MGEAKTQPTLVGVDAFIAAVEPPAKAADGKVLDALFRKVTGEVPQMWGPSIVGYGEYHTVYDSGREVRSLRTGFSPRKAKHSLYLSCTCKGAEDPAFTALLGRLGKFARGAGSCLYVNKLADIDLEVLEELIACGWENSFRQYPADASAHG